MRVYVSDEGLVVLLLFNNEKHIYNNYLNLNIY